MVNEYVYLSNGKVAEFLPDEQPWWSRLRATKYGGKVGAAGAEVSLEFEPSEAAASEARLRKIRDHIGEAARWFEEPGLTAGEWVFFEGRIGYQALDEGGVLFCQSGGLTASGNRIVLHGSAKNLRGVTRRRFRFGFDAGRRLLESGRRGIGVASSVGTGRRAGGHRAAFLAAIHRQCAGEPVRWLRITLPACGKPLRRGRVYRLVPPPRAISRWLRTRHRGGRATFAAVRCRGSLTSFRPAGETLSAQRTLGRLGGSRRFTSRQELWTFCGHVCLGVTLRPADTTAEQKADPNGVTADFTPAHRERGLSEFGRHRR